jgi:cell volume regulation protein A
LLAGGERNWKRRLRLKLQNTYCLPGLILAFGTITGLLSQKIGIPDGALFLIAGMLIGPEMLGLINIRADSPLNQIILLFGASYILFDGGASLRFNVLKRVWITILVISTIGVVITAAITGVAAYHILDVPFIVALLLGATLASMDPATPVPIFRQVKISDRVAQTVMSESAFNDAMGAIVTFGVLAVAMGKGEFSLTSSLLDLFKQSIIGIAAGAALGYLAALLIAHERWAFLAEYGPVVTLMAVIGAYFAADGLQDSGFMAVFVFGIVLGNKEAFGFKMEAGEAYKLVVCDDHRVHHAVIHFHPARRSGQFQSYESIPDGRRRCGDHLHVGRAAGDRFLVCAAGQACAVELQ